MLHIYLGISMVIIRILPHCSMRHQLIIFLNSAHWQFLVQISQFTSVSFLEPTNIQNVFPPSIFGSASTHYLSLCSGLLISSSNFVVYQIYLIFEKPFFGPHKAFGPLEVPFTKCISVGSPLFTQKFICSSTCTATTHEMAGI